jgi:dTDP-4-dehydrorhamnose reductase
VFPDAVKLTRNNLDITNKQQVLKTIEEIKPDVVINAAAYTNVDGCEDMQDLAFKANGHAPGYIAQACANIGAILVHFSTDYVFDGLKREYAESDTTNPINIYGRSKLMGEQEVIKNTDNYRIIRTSWLFGKNGKNFVDTMLKLSKERGAVKVVNDQSGKPTYTTDLTRKTSEIINLNPGIYHITNEGQCTWYEFASEIIKNAVPCSSDEFPTKAKRPTYSVLTNTKTTPMRHWKDALNEYLKEKQS